MNATRTLALTAVIAVAVAAVAISADKPVKAPDLPNKLKVLERFVGDWEETVTIPKAKWNTQARRLTSTTSTTRILGGRFIRSEGKLSDGTTTLTLVTYDERKQSYRMWYFNSHGVAMESAGRWDPKTETMTLRHDSSEGIVATGTSRSTGDDTAEWHATTKDAEGTVCFRVEVKQTRIKPSKSKPGR